VDVFHFKIPPNIGFGAVVVGAAVVGFAVAVAVVVGTVVAGAVVCVSLPQPMNINVLIRTKTRKMGIYFLIFNTTSLLN
jgi:hypothetical protein